MVDRIALPPTGRLLSVPLVAHRAVELEDLPAVRAGFVDQEPYVKVVDHGRPVLNPTTTDALNFGLLLVAEAGHGPIASSLVRSRSRGRPPHAWPGRVPAMRHSVALVGSRKPYLSGCPMTSASERNPMTRPLFASLDPELAAASVLLPEIDLRKPGDARRLEQRR
jgi:hypothetical protein